MRPRLHPLVRDRPHRGIPAEVCQSPPSDLRVVQRALAEVLECRLDVVCELFRVKAVDAAERLTVEASVLVALVKTTSAAALRLCSPGFLRLSRRVAKSSPMNSRTNAAQASGSPPFPLVPASASASMTIAPLVNTPKFGCVARTRTRSIPLRSIAWKCCVSSFFSLLDSGAGGTRQTLGC